MKLKTLLTEPLVHFTLIGALLFGWFSYLNATPDESAQKILVTSYKVNQLATVLSRKWGREPTREELKGLVDEYIIEEVYYREALAMGMDKDDTVIRRRLRQKMSFLLEDSMSNVEPTDQALNAFLEANLDKFRWPSQYSFKQIYLDPNQDGREARIREIQQRLDGGLEPGGDPIGLPDRMENVTTDEIDHKFGGRFSQHFNEVPLNQWVGPMASGFGLHWVYIDQHQPARPAELSEVRDRVLEEYRYDSRVNLQQQVTDRLLEQYVVEIQWPDEPDGSDDSK